MLELRIFELEYRKVVMVELTEKYLRIVKMEQLKVVREIVKIIELF